MSSDDLLRSYAELHAREASGIEPLVQESAEDLYILLAMRVGEPGAGSSVAGNRFSPEFSSDDLMRSDAMAELGKNIFRRWSQALHSFLCAPNQKDEQLRKDMLRAIFSKDGGAAAIVAGGLVAAFGLSPAIAAVIAALAIKLLVAPAADEICKSWEKILQNSTNSVA